MNGRVERRTASGLWIAGLSSAAALCLSITAAGMVPQAAPGAGDTRPKDECTPQWTTWQVTDGPPFRFEYRSAAGDRPAGSPYPPHCLHHQLRNAPGKLPVRVEWFAQDGKSLLMYAELEACGGTMPDTCRASASSVPSFSKVFLPSSFRFGSRRPGDKTANSNAWQRQPENAAPPTAASFAILPSAARGSVVGEDGRIEFEFAFRAYSSVRAVNGNWEITNEIEFPDPERRAPKNVVIGPRAGDPRIDDPVMTWAVPMGSKAVRQQVANGARSTLVVSKPAMSPATRLEIRVKNEIRFAITVPAYVDATALAVQ